MSEFFSGWRRKIGVMTLMMACGLMALWVRSFTRWDSVYVNSNRFKSHFWLNSVDGRFWSHKLIATVTKRTSVTWATSDISALVGYGLDDQKSRSPNKSDLFRDLEFCNSDWRWDWGGFHYGVGTNWEKTFSAVDWTIPYWSIVIPLTLISFWLLLSKPRKSTQDKTPERNDCAR